MKSEGNAGKKIPVYLSGSADSNNYFEYSTLQRCSKSQNGRSEIDAVTAALEVTNTTTAKPARLRDFNYFQSMTSFSTRVAFAIHKLIDALKHCPKILISIQRHVRHSNEMTNFIVKNAH